MVHLHFFFTSMTKHENASKVIIISVAIAVAERSEGSCPPRVF